MNDIISLASQLISNNLNWAESTSEPMKFRLFIDHIIIPLVSISEILRP